jgi:hypothetical protein
MQGGLRMGRGRKQLRLMGAAMLAISVLMPLGSTAPALATPPPVHNIATCADLQTLGQDNSTRSDTINLTADLDCSGIASFAPLYLNGLSGIFDGHGHSISHLTVNMPTYSCVGLFRQVIGGTIQNLRLLSGSIVGNNDTAALVGCAGGATITNVTSAIDVSGSDGNVGGLIGYLFSQGDSLVQDSSATGSVTSTVSFFFGGGPIGGLVGIIIAQNANITLRRVFATGTVTSGDHSAGGLVGMALAQADVATSTITIADSYSHSNVSAPGKLRVGGILGYGQATGSGAVGTINLTHVYASGTLTGQQNVGGLVGYGNTAQTGQFTIASSFATGSVTATTSGAAGILGYNNAASPSIITSTHSYYDGPGTGQSVCDNHTAMAGDCTRINTAAQPNYFKTSHANAPFDTWDFDNVWTTVPGGYPELIPPDDGDGIALADELAAPNGGDANADGTADAAQASVAAFPNTISGHYAVLQSSCGALANNTRAVAEATASSADIAFNYPAGLMDFTVTGCTPGTTVTITQYFYGSFDDPSALVMRKWNSTSNAYTTIPGAALSTVTIGGQTVLKTVYQVADGGALDQDGTADGAIIDPAGPAAVVISAPNTGFGGGH